jgi:hypothetical protein
MTESAGRARLIADLRFRADSWDGQRYGDKGLRLRAEDTVRLLREAAEALAGQEEAPQPESGCGRHEGVSIGKPCGECQLERVTELENALEVAQEAAAEWRTRLAELIAAKAEEDAPAPPRETGK